MCVEASRSVGSIEKDSEAMLGVWLPAPLPTPRALPDHGALWPLAVGVEKDLGGIDVGPCGIVCCSLCGLTHPPNISRLSTIQELTTAKFALISRLTAGLTQSKSRVNPSCVTRP